MISFTNFIIHLSSILSLSEFQIEAVQLITFNLLYIIIQQHLYCLQHIHINRDRNKHIIIIKLVTKAVSNVLLRSIQSAKVVMFEHLFK